MNYDRFSTRVWDKKEKKMYYQNKDYSIVFVLKDYTGLPVDDVAYTQFLGVDNNNILFSYFNWESEEVITHIPFGNRFIPMQCRGSEDKNGKLIYEKDIVKDRYDNLFILEYLDATPIFISIKNPGELREPLEIIGNKFQNPELMEESK